MGCMLGIRVFFYFLPTVNNVTTIVSFYIDVFPFLWIMYRGVELLGKIAALCLTL